MLGVPYFFVKNCGNAVYYKNIEIEDRMKSIKIYIVLLLLLSLQNVVGMDEIFDEWEDLFTDIVEDFDKSAQVLSSFPEGTIVVSSPDKNQADIIIEEAPRKYQKRPAMYHPRLKQAQQAHDKQKRLGTERLSEDEKLLADEHALRLETARLKRDLNKIASNIVLNKNASGQQLSQGDKSLLAQYELAKERARTYSKNKLLESKQIEIKIMSEYEQKLATKKRNIQELT